MSKQRDNGIVIGIVADLDDPEGLGRVQVSIPHLGDQLSDWARLVSLMAGAERGVFFRPEKDDEVLVGFEHGDPRRPYILGGLWSKADQPPADDGKAKQNNWRFITLAQRPHHQARRHTGAERIEIIDKDGNRTDHHRQRRARRSRSSATRRRRGVSRPRGNVTIKAQDITVHADNGMTLKAEGT